MVTASEEHGTHKARDTHCICGLDGSANKPGGWPQCLISTSAPLDGILVHICTKYHLLIPGEVLGQRVEAAEDIQNQMIGLGGLVPLQQKRQSKLY